MHHSYSSIISRKFITIFLNKSIYCIYIKSFNVFSSFLQIFVRGHKICKNYTLLFIKINDEGLEHCIKSYWSPNFFPGVKKNNFLEGRDGVFWRDFGWSYSSIAQNQYFFCWISWEGSRSWLPIKVWLWFRLAPFLPWY